MNKFGTQTNAPKCDVIGLAQGFNKNWLDRSGAPNSNNSKLNLTHHSTQKTPHSHEAGYKRNDPAKKSGSEFSHQIDVSSWNNQWWVCERLRPTLFSAYFEMRSERKRFGAKKWLGNAFPLQKLGPHLFATVQLSAVPKTYSPSFNRAMKFVIYNKLHWRRGDNTALASGRWSIPLDDEIAWRLLRICHWKFD